MNLSSIHAAIPHRAPFLLVDEIIRQDDRTIHCRKRFAEDEYFFAGHYPDYPLVPGVLLCEAAMQAGAILLSKQCSTAGPDRLPVATRMNDVRFKRIVRPGETIEIEVVLNEQLGDAFFLNGKISVAGTVAARLEFACTLTPRPA